MFDDLTKGTYCISISLTALRKQITPMMYLIMLKVHVLYMFLQGSQIQEQRQKQTKSECWCENVVFTSSRILV